MTKTDIAKQLSSRCVELSQYRAEVLVNDVLDIIKGALVAGDTINLPRIGRFVVKDTAERTARNPKTGEPIKVPAGKRVTFKASPVLNEQLKK